MGSGPTSLESMRGDKDEDALSEDDDCIGSWLSQGCGWTGRFGAGWRRGLSITFGADSRNGRSTERCTFGHNRFFEATEKLDVQTRKSTDAFAVARCKIGLEKSSRSNINGTHTGNKFSRSGIWRRTVISSSCTKYEAKEVSRSRPQRTFRNIKSSELSAAQLHWATHFPISPLAANWVYRAKSTGSSPIANRRRSS